MTVAQEVVRLSSLKGTSYSQTSGAQSERGLETDKDALANELEQMRVKLAERDTALAHAKRWIEHQLEQQAARETPLSQIFKEHAEPQAVRSVDVDKRVDELKGELGSARERLTLRENENRSLQTSLNLMISENSRLSRRLSESAAELNEANEKRRTEAMMLNTRFEVMSSRALAAEKLIEEVRQSLLARVDEKRADGRKVTDGTVARGAVDNKLVQLQNSLQIKLPVERVTPPGAGDGLIKIQKEIRALDFRLQCELEKHANAERTCNGKNSEQDEVRYTESLLASILCV
jgi:hypothetical protein